MSSSLDATRRDRHGSLHANIDDGLAFSPTAPQVEYTMSPCISLKLMNFTSADKLRVVVIRRFIWSLSICYVAVDVQCRSKL